MEFGRQADQAQAFLRSNLARILDRIETNEVLEHLLEKRSARRTYALEVEGRSMPPVEATDVSEEGEIVWWPAEDRVWR